MKHNLKGGLSNCLTSIRLAFLFISLITEILLSDRLHAQCTLLTPNQMSMSIAEFIPGDYDYDSLLTLSTYSFSNGGDPVTGIHILPIQFINPADSFVAGLDYTACINAGAGTGSISFLREGTFAVRIDRASTDNDTMMLNVVTVRFKEQGHTTGPPKEFPCPPYYGIFEGADVVAPNTAVGLTGGIVVSSVDALVDSINSHAGGGSIDVIINDHGKTGKIMINGQDVTAGSANFKKLCSLKGKIKSLTLLSCSSGAGLAGADFLKKLSECLGGIKVSGFTGDVEAIFDSKLNRLVWVVYGDTISKTSPVKEVKKPNHEIPPMGPYLEDENGNIQFNSNIIIREIEHDNFTNQSPPPPNGVTQFYNFNSTVEFEMSTNGGLSWQYIYANAINVISVTNTGNAGPVEHYDTEMLLFNISGGNLPPGMILRESPSQISDGHTEIRALAPNGFGYSSYFDIRMEVSMNNGTNWIPAQDSTELILAGPLLNAIPTLSEWGLILLGIVLLFTGGLHLLKRPFDS